MEFPKFLLGDNTDYPTAIFVVHTEYPRFIINLENDEVEWLEDFTKEDEKELEEELNKCKLLCANCHTEEHYKMSDLT